MPLVHIKLSTAGLLETVEENNNITGGRIFTQRFGEQFRLKSR